MPVTSTSFARSTALFLIVGLLALLGIVAMSLWLGQRTQLYFNEVIAARDARSATTDLRKLVHDAESSQRGFLLTMEEQYLEPFNAARGSIMPGYEVMRRAVEPFAQAKELATGLKVVLEAKISELDQTIALARAGRRDEAMAIVRTDRGKALMDEAQATLSAVVGLADTRLTEGVEEQRWTAAALRWVTVLGALVIVLVVGGSVWTAVSYTRELLRARGEVESLNSGLEERVKERTVDLGRANEEIQRFAYIVTHDLRAPLVNIMGFTSELETGLATVQAAFGVGDAEADGPPPDERRREAAELAVKEDMPEAIGFIRSSTQKMDGLINAILKLSRDGRRPLKPERIELASFFDAAISAVQHQISEAGGELSLDLGVSTVVSDRMSLGQVVGNLLDNAVKYREKRRALVIAIRTRDAPGRRIAIEVEDNGRGIAAEDHERVFELFRRSGPQDQQGEGIGLPHVRGMVRAMGGDVTVASTLGQGSIFTITLPKDLKTAVSAAANGVR